MVSFGRGKTATQHGMVQCSFCKPGMYSPNASSSTPCKNCPSGYYIQIQGQSSCSKCIPGRVQAVSGEIDCIGCGLHLFTNVSAQINCSKCPNGWFSSRQGSVECQKCSAGQFSKVSGTPCQFCLPGYYTGNLATVKCDKLDKGYFVGAGSTLQIPCDAGKYSSSSRLSRLVSGCLPCPAGHACPRGSHTPKSCLAGTSAGKGSTTCVSCTLGKFIAEGNATQCQQCKIGQYNDARGSTQCVDCPIDTYSKKSGATAREQCEQCPEKTSTNGTTAQTAIESCICAPKYFRSSRRISNASESVVCDVCPEGAVCASSGTITETLETQKGWWRSDVSKEKFYQCHVSSDCIGGLQKMNTSSDALCLQGHSGVLCAVCSVSYVRTNRSNCMYCGTYQNTTNTRDVYSLGGAFMTLVAVVFSIFFVVVLIIITRPIPKKEKQKKKSTSDVKKNKKKHSLVKVAIVIRSMQRLARGAKTSENSLVDSAQDAVIGEGTSQIEDKVDGSLANLTGDDAGEIEVELPQDATSIPSTMWSTLLSQRIRILIGYLQVVAVRLYSFCCFICCFFLLFLCCCLSCLSHTFLFSCFRISFYIYIGTRLNV